MKQPTNTTTPKPRPNNYSMGLVQIAEWTNTNTDEKGQEREYYTYTIKRSVRDQSGNIVDAKNFGLNELMRLRVLIDRVLENSMRVEEHDHT